MNNITEKDIKEAMWVINRGIRDLQLHPRYSTWEIGMSMDILRTLRAALKGIDAVIKTATNMMNCSHELCSMSEAVYEEIHGKMFLNIVNSCCSGIEVVDE